MRIKRATILTIIFLNIFIFSNTVAECMPVNENIFRWIQSSSRMTYYFNQQQICYKMVNGEIDFNTLIVPILKVYDSIQIKDTVDKRRWHMKPISTFRDLIGHTEYAEIDLKNRIVYITRYDYVDSTWSPIESVNPALKFNLDSMAEKNLDRTFFLAIIDYANKHQLELAMRTSSNLTPEQAKLLEKSQELYINNANPKYDDEINEEIKQLLVNEPYGDK